MSLGAWASDASVSANELVVLVVLLLVEAAAKEESTSVRGVMVVEDGTQPHAKKGVEW
jgi:hypothetical protein